MKYLMVKLKPRSFLHLGEREGWYEGSKSYISSDTIFSALCHCHLLLYGEVDSFIKAFTSDEPPFLLSSAFPYWEENLYFPLPKNQFIRDKDLKKIKFVNLKLLERLLAGKKIEELKEEIQRITELDFLPRFEKSNSLQPINPYTVENIPRVALSRLSNHPGENFFYFGQIKYREKAGLFILIDMKNKEWESSVKALFRLFADEGIGGDRTCGKGLFHSPEFASLEIPENSDSNAFYALSTYFPKPQEISGLENCFYDLELRKGYIYSPANKSYRRRSIRVFSEGSVFTGQKRIGSLVDITPEIFKTHRIYRYGLLFSIPCKMEAK